MMVIAEHANGTNMTNTVMIGFVQTEKANTLLILPDVMIAVRNLRKGKSDGRTIKTMSVLRWETRI